LLSLSRSCYSYRIHAYIQFVYTDFTQSFTLFCNHFYRSHPLLTSIEFGGYYCNRCEQLSSVQNMGNIGLFPENNNLTMCGAYESQLLCLASTCVYPEFQSFSFLSLLTHFSFSPLLLFYFRMRGILCRVTVSMTCL